MCKVGDVVEDRDLNVRLSEMFQNERDVNRVMLIRVGREQWRITQVDSNRPNDLSEIGRKMAGVVYERDNVNNLEYVTAYAINSDDFGRVVYRIA